MKQLYCLAAFFMLLLSSQSCVTEEGAGTPSPKKLFIEQSTYEVNLSDTEVTSFFFRWIDVSNATYKVEFSVETGTDSEGNEITYTQLLNNKVTSEQLDVLSMEITDDQIAQFLQSAQLSGQENVAIEIILTGTPIDLKLPTALAPEGSVKKATIHIVP